MKMVIRVLVALMLLYALPFVAFLDWAGSDNDLLTSFRNTWIEYKSMIHIRTPY